MLHPSTDFSGRPRVFSGSTAASLAHDTVRPAVGTIRKPDNAPLVHLLHTHTVGRASNCDLVVARSSVSSHHAVIRWDQAGYWTVRDLGSRNGTYINGRRLGGDAQRLGVGDIVGFSERDELWELVDDGAPESLLICLDTQGSGEHPLIHLGTNDIIALPSDENVLATVFSRDGNWRLEQGPLVRTVDHGDEFEVGPIRYRIHLAGMTAPTTDATVPTDPKLHNITLELLVAADEESAAARVQVGGRVHELKRRGYLYLLVFLARERMKSDEQEGPSAGWIDVSSTCRELQLSTPEALALLVHRCRKAIRQCGVSNPADIVDRSRKGLLRIGIEPEQLIISAGH